MHAFIVYEHEKSRLIIVLMLLNIGELFQPLDLSLDDRGSLIITPQLSLSEVILSI